MAKRLALVSSSAELDARLLVGHRLGLNDVQLVCNERMLILPGQLNEIEALATRRLLGEPVARILGVREFYGLEFELNDATLVPRPDTEMLVARAIELLGDRSGVKFLDLGFGSGCIAVSILKHLPNAKGIGVDIGEQALAMAEKNATRHGVATRVQWLVGAWFEPLLTPQKFDLIVSNPPYISGNVIEQLQSDVRDFDPVAALDGGTDGLDAYRAILSHALDWLTPKGSLLLEIGFDQGASVRALCEGAGFTDVELHTDLAGLARMIEAKRGV